jgi:hypothetical protein
MSRFEGPFDAQDICRIWLNNLGTRDQADSLCWFYSISPIFFGVNQPLPTGLTRTLLESAIGILPLGGTATKIVGLVENLAPTVNSR